MGRRAIRAMVITDISFGDAGKGTTVDYLVHRAQSAVVVRHNGGPQAAHNVVTPDGRHHTFAQFGSGSFVPGVLTHLSGHMLVNPLNMFPEAGHLQSIGVRDIWERLSVDRQAPVVMPWQSAANQLRELARGNGRHGSCGQGIGETMADMLAEPGLAIRAGDLQASPARLKRQLQQHRAAKYDRLRQELACGTSDLHGNEAGQARHIWSMFSDPGLVDRLAEAYRDWADKVRIVGDGYLRHLADSHELLVFEGAQGVLLDEWYGFHPYTTWSTTTHANALGLLADMDYPGPVTRFGVMRAYTTRHGAGPFVSQDAGLTRLLPDYHNGTGEWQGTFRVGHLDLVAHRYALAACGSTDTLVVTGLDRLNALPESEWQVCNRYRLLGAHADAASYFEFDGHGLVSDIKLGLQGDLLHQARLTELLQSCEPVLHRLSGSSGSNTPAGALLETIEDCLGLQPSVTSFGPTAADKRALVPAY